MKPLAELLEASAALHRHLCPRQVLGARMGMLAGELLGLDLPQTDTRTFGPSAGKRLYAIVETDGCFTDGVSAATNCWVGRRTMRVEDYGKVATTFVDTQTGQAIRIVPQSDVRLRARDYAPEARNKWETMLLGYQRIPAGELLSALPVQLKTPMEKIASRAGVKALCEICGEEIMNEREVIRDGAILCRACAGHAYYVLMAEGTLPNSDLLQANQDMMALLVAA
ncbi:MAG: TraR/DksA C4-type zinc finger protein [Chloroflexi bacterium]|nr:TraR/DksA C4-type zinc finger protein [Chloroflexota bacterium]MBI5829622.1 TraR/DksA C4-type zinc finger protein [Chloroflexota bacterium]